MYVPDFNTSHVTVYQTAPGGNGHSKIISIHLMLRFIEEEPQGFHSVWLISIHLMLRFIKVEEVFLPAERVFQYISCYGLSGHRNDIDDLYANFNTSHVTVYLNIRLPLT